MSYNTVKAKNWVKSSWKNSCVRDLGAKRPQNGLKMGSFKFYDELKHDVSNFLHEVIAV